VSDVLVLCYHAVSESWPAALSTTPQRFEEQLRWLVGAGYRGVTFEQAVAGERGGRVVAVTFDDAYRSVLELAFPVMQRLGLPGTVFVPTAFAGKPGPMAWEGIDRWLGGPHETEMSCMGWDELRRLAGAGWEVGSHTRTHPHLTRLDDERLASELGESLTECSDGMGSPCRSIAYPYGDVDERVAAAAGAAGYRVAAALPKRLGGADPLAWPRVGVYHRDDLCRFRLKVSPALRRLRSSRLWDAALRARRGSR
jgi:peptidoglycan/xylan/chitin deacetylase (PgdA/CDA1 family)